MWLKFDRDSSGDLNMTEIKEVVNALNLPDSLEQRLTARLKASKVCFLFVSRTHTSTNQSIPIQLDTPTAI